MSEQDELATALRSAARLARYYQTGLEPLLTRAANALQSRRPEPATRTLCDWCDKAGTGTALWQGNGIRHPSCGEHGFDYRPDAEPVTPETETEWEYAIRTESTGKIEPDTEDGARWTAKYANIGAAGTETYTLMSRPVGPWLPVEDGDENS